MEDVRTWLAILAACAGAIGCGGSPTDPTDGSGGLEFPVLSTSCAPIGSGSTSTHQTVYFIQGLSQDVADPSASPLKAVLGVGDEVQVTLGWEGCGSTRDETWVSSRPGVASVEVDPAFGGLVARLTARAVGETDVFVEFLGPDDRRHRTYPAYCPASQYVCVDPRTPFTRVEVAAATP